MCTAARFLTKSLVPIASCFFASFVVNETHFHHEGPEEHEDQGQTANPIPSVLASVDSVLSVVKMEVLHHRGHREHRGNV
jgi:hypothetical protein